MSKTAKEIVTSFYETDLIHTPEAFSEYLHPEVQLDWTSSFGFRKKNLEDIKMLFEGMSTSFETLRCEISHLVSEKSMVTLRGSYIARLIENPEKEEVIAHCMAIWELKDDKLYRGYMISQHGDNSKESLASFLSK
ncbi:hypothetical protein GCM10022393_14220 [Aquimarina addita]|uniref:SnoaL-like domain-containing protein n=1 Tax=Aquimarina addita TaxID=870485 RepID=A0ABP7XFF5_9FLAO